MPGIIVFEKETEVKLIELMQLQDTLKKKGGASEDGQLFEEIIDRENEILKIFGLPVSPDYLGAIQFDGLPNENDIKHRIEKLKKAATDYLMSNAKSDLAILKDARDRMLEASDILPELRVITHIYTIYVYGVVLLKRKDEFEPILEELRFVNDNPDILGIIGDIGMNYIPDISNAAAQPDIFYNLDGEDKKLNPWEIVDLLEAKGVKYIRRYIVSLSGFLDDDDY